MRRPALIVLLTVLGAIGGLPAQAPLRLTLDQALERSRSAHPALAAARVLRQGAEADRLASLAAFLPRVSTEWGVARTDDPVQVFGAKLRQRVFAGSDLVLEALNRPIPITDNWMSLTVEQPVLVPEGWYGRRSASAGADAGRLAEARAVQLSALDVVGKYFGAVLSVGQVQLLDTELVAARATLDRVRALRREGVVTGVDELLGRARLSGLEAERAKAEAERLAASDRLLLAMGEAPGGLVELVDSIGPEGQSPAGDRPDVAASRALLDARLANVSRTQWQRLPSLGAFGSLGWNQGTVGFGGASHWTAGLMVRWTLFRGLGDVGALRQARAEVDRARADLAALERSASAEVRAAEARLQAADGALAATDRALESATEALRIATARYLGGVATIAELLAVQSSVAEQRLTRLRVKYDARMAQAELTVARGGDPR